MEKVIKPEWKWYFIFPFVRGAKDYKKDREIYEDQFLNEFQLKIKNIRKNQQMYINSLSAIIILIITILWTLLPNMVELPKWLLWTKMGMKEFGSDNWGNQFFLTAIPTTAGTFLHNFHKFIPSKKIKIIVDLFIKLLPVIILLICFYLIITEKKVFKVKKQYKITENQLLNIIK